MTDQGTRALTAPSKDDPDLLEDEQERAEDAADAAEEEEYGEQVVFTPLAKMATELHAGQAAAEKADDDQWKEANVLEPRYSPRGLLHLYSNSNALRQNIDAIAQNEDGFGWTPEPVIDFEAEDLATQVATAMLLDAIARWEAGGMRPEAKPQPPTTEEVTATVARWKAESAIEKARMRQHFDYACVEMSFVDLRKRTTTDREIVGWGSWEVIRANGTKGPPRRYIHVPSYTLRFKPLSEPVRVLERIHTSPYTYCIVPVFRRFHVIVQQDENQTGMPVRYFREFGDPRIVSSKSGEVYDDEDALLAAEGEDAVPANEILLFRSYFPGCAYGAPRYHGVLPELKGSWLAANHNVDYLENAAIPRGILMVSGGRLNKRSVRGVKNWFGTAKGKAHSRMMVVQATVPKDRAYEGGTQVKMEFVNLATAQREDAMFDTYDKRVADKVSQSFRLPPILRGETRDFNRATAQASLAYAEEQVFAPDRASFDHMVNTRILPELRIRFWRFKSRGPSKQDPEVMAKLLETLLKYAVVVPAEVRSIAERLLGIDLLRIAGPFQQVPIQLAQQGVEPPVKQKPATEEGGGGEGGPPGSAEQEQQKRVVKAAEAMEELRQIIGEDQFDAVVEDFRRSMEGDRASFETVGG